MTMTSAEIEGLLKQAFPDAYVVVAPLADDNDHYAVRVVAEAFKGLPRVKQHQLVYAALGGKVGNELHALALETSAPK